MNVERAIGPVARHFARRQRAAHRALGEIGRVLALVLGRAAPGPERTVGAVGSRVVADEEVGAELRRRQIEPAADGVVARGDREQNERKAQDESAAVVVRLKPDATAGRYDWPLASGVSRTRVVSGFSRTQTP